MEKDDLPEAITEKDDLSEAITPGAQPEIPPSSRLALTLGMLPVLSKKYLVFLRSHLWLIVPGLICELIYSCYLLHDFPLTRYYSTLTDMGGIANFSHSSFLKFVLCFSLLFALFGLVWYRSRQLQGRMALGTILIFGALFATTSLFVYPINAIDVFIYFGQSLVLLQYHANPMTIAPIQFAGQDPLMRLTGGFITKPSPYGPLGILIQAIPALLGGRNVFAALLLTKLLCSILLLASAFFIYKILLHLAPRYALAGVLALAWNPFALLEYSANSHNDIIMMFFAVLAVYALVKEHSILALTLIVASALIKFAALPLIPLILLYGFLHQPSWKQRLVYSLGLIIPISFVWIYMRPFWQGPETFTRLVDQTQGTLYSFSMFLADFLGDGGKAEQTIGLLLFALCFLYALWTTRGSLTDMLRGCFVVMFALLAFAATYLQVWYLIWPFIFALFLPGRRMWFAAFLLVYTATLVELVHGYLWHWGIIYSSNVFAIVNSVVYLALFAPSLLLLCSSELMLLLSPMPGRDDQDRGRGARRRYVSENSE